MLFTLIVSPMILPTPRPQYVQELQDLYQRKYGATITTDEAYQLLTILLTHTYLTEYEPVRPLRQKV